MNKNGDIDCGDCVDFYAKNVNASKGGLLHWIQCCDTADVGIVPGCCIKTSFTVDIGDVSEGGSRQSNTG